jgi:hypothetical protein
VSEVRNWPQCAECSARYQGWWPVEAYRIEEQKVSSLRLAKVVHVIAECAHLGHVEGGAARTSDRDVQRATIEVPFWWGDAHVSAAIRKLVFFRPGHSTAEHGMVTNIG